MAEADNKLTNLVNRKHPYYVEKLVHWQFLNSTYESPREWFVDNLFRFVREGDETYKGRLQRAYRFNHTREVVDLVNKYLFKNPPERSDDVPEEVKRFRERATLSGLTLEQFERQVSRKASIYGRVYVVLDNNAKPDEIVTKADEKSGNVRLYSYIVTPDQMRDVGFDRDGNYNWILISEKVRDDSDPFEADGDIYEQYRLWTKTHWYLFDKKTEHDETVVELVDSGEHGLGVVPVIKCDHIESDNKYAVPSLIEDIAYLDRAVANYCSNLDQIINDQTFSQLTIPAQGLIAGIGSTLSTVDPTDPDILKKQRDIVQMGTSQILIYDGAESGPPTYISPDPRQAQLIITTIKQIINEIYHTVGLSGERTKQDNSMGIDNSSGVAKAFDFERVNALLAAKANAMEAFSNRLENLVQIYHGAAPETLDTTASTVKYSVNFDVRSLNDELAIAQSFATLMVPMDVRKMHMKDIVPKIWPMLSEEDEKKIESAIDKWEDPLTMMAQQMQATGGKSGVDKSDPMGKNTTQGFPGKKPDPGKK